MKPVIVVNAFRRPLSLQRLLKSLLLANIEQDTHIVFSLEYGAADEVVKQVTEFKWPYGNKTILTKDEKLGLINHFIFCGDLTAKYGTIIYLEDDLFVGTDFQKYTHAVLAAYGDEQQLAGFSLNALWFNGYLHQPFRPVDDGNPCFFLQVPWYQGQVYTARQWQHFRDWYNNYKGVNHTLQMHPVFKNYQLTDDWFPVKTQYLIETGNYYCFPRVAQCVNFGDKGTHFKNKTDFFQTELALHFADSKFKGFADSLAVYDSFFELLPSRFKVLASELMDIDFEADLNATKDISLVTSEYLITPVKPVKYLRKYALDMRPQELNIVYNIEGEYFYLAKRKDIPGAAARNNIFYNQFYYHNRFKLTRKQKINIFLR